MAYVAPNSRIRLVNVNLDNRYINTIYFANETAQNTYFLGLDAVELNAQSYQRHGENRCRLQVSVDAVLNKNYIMFQNTSFGSKWFYGFITDCQYINNVTTEIEYEIDVMQTFFFTHCVMHQCMVEREHIATDTRGANLVAESFDLEDYIMDDDYTYTSLAPIFALQGIALFTTMNGSGQHATGNMLSGVYSGAGWTIVSETNYSALNTELENITNIDGGVDSIVNIVQIPWVFANEINSTPSVCPAETITLNNVLTNLTDLDGYTPKNKKLLTYPYTFMYATLGYDNGITYKYEYFDSDSVEFKAELFFSSTPQMDLYCSSTYKEKNRYDNVISFNSFPQCSYSIDAFRAWLAQNAIPTLTDSLSGVIGMGASALSGGNPARGLGEVVSNASNFISNGVMASLKGGKLKNNVNNGMVQFAAKDFFPHIFRYSIRSDTAKRIDDYFERYGYATNELKIPNINSRPYWNYVKTVNSNVTGSCPISALSKINAIFNKGITFWKSTGTVGDYSQNNH